MRLLPPILFPRKQFIDRASNYARIKHLALTYFSSNGTLFFL